MLVELLLKKDSEIYQRDATIAAKDAELAEAERNLNIYQKMLSDINRARFAPKSEKRPIGDNNQVSLFSLIPGFELKHPEPASPETPVPAHTRAARTKRDLSKLPHNRIEVLPPSTKQIRYNRSLGEWCNRRYHGVRVTVTSCLCSSATDSLKLARITNLGTTYAYPFTHFPLQTHADR